MDSVSRRACQIIRTAARIAVYSINSVMSYRHWVVGVGRFTPEDTDLYTMLTNIEGDLILLVSKCDKALEIGET